MDPFLAGFMDELVKSSAEGVDLKEKLKKLKKLDKDVAVYKTYYGQWPAVRAGVEALQGGIEGGIIGGAVGAKGGRGRAALAGAGIGIASGMLDTLVERMSERGRQKFLKTRAGREAMKKKL